MTNKQTDQRFIVAYISFFDNELTQELVVAKDWREAVIKRVGADYLDDFAVQLAGMEQEDLGDFFFDVDAQLSVYEL